MHNKTTRLLLGVCLCCLASACVDGAKDMFWRGGGGTNDISCSQGYCNWEIRSLLKEGDIEWVDILYHELCGISMIADNVSISYLADRDKLVIQTDEVDGGLWVPDCFIVKIIADTDSDSEMVFEADFQDDGVAEFTKVLKTDDWNTSIFTITPPNMYDAVRFSVKKTRPGKAVLVYVQVRTESDQDCEDINES